MGLGTENNFNRDILPKTKEDQSLPISFSLKYEFIAACALSSNSGSWHCWNCNSEASTLAGASELTSSIVHSNCVLLCCGVAGRWNRDGLDEIQWKSMFHHIQEKKKFPDLTYKSLANAIDRPSVARMDLQFSEIETHTTTVTTTKKTHELPVSNDIYVCSFFAEKPVLGLAVTGFSAT